jgi:hypothetical protein
LKQIYSGIGRSEFSLATYKLEGKLEGKLEIAMRMLTEGISVVDVCRLTSLSEEEIRKLLSLI